MNEEIKKDTESLFNTIVGMFMAVGDMDKVYEVRKMEDEYTYKLTSTIQQKQDQILDEFVRECIEAKLEFKDFATRDKFEEILKQFKDRKEI